MYNTCRIGFKGYGTNACPQAWPPLPIMYISGWTGNQLHSSYMYINGWMRKVAEVGDNEEGQCKAKWGGRSMMKNHP